MMVKGRRLVGLVVAFLAIGSLVLAGPAEAGTRASVAVALSDPLPGSVTAGDMSSPVLLSFPSVHDTSLAAQVQFKTGNWVRCTLVGRWETTFVGGPASAVADLRYWLSCSRGWQFDDEWWALRATSGGCAGISTAVNVDNEDSSTGLIINDCVTSLADGEAQVCLGRSGGTWGFGGSAADAEEAASSSADCVVWNIGSPPDGGEGPVDLSGCPWATPTAPVVAGWNVEPFEGEPNRRYLRWRAQMSVAVTDPLPAGWKIRPYAIWDTTGMNYGSNGAQGGGETTRFVDWVRTAPTGQLITRWTNDADVDAGSWSQEMVVKTAKNASITYWPADDVSGAVTPTLVGLGYSLWIGNETPNSQSGVIPPSGSNRPAATLGDGILVPVPSGAGFAPLDRYLGGGFVGIHAPQYCSWYWGVRVADTTASPDIPDADEPAGPVGGGPGGPEPSDPQPVYVGDDIPPGGCPEGAICVEVPAPPDADDEGDSCGDGFKVSDPTTWAGAALCGVVKMLAALIKTVGKLIDAVLGLVGALLTGLKDLFVLLFVPDGDAWSGLVDGLRGTVEDSAVGDWLDAFSVPDPGGGGVAGRPAARAAAAGGCEGPSFDLSSMPLLGPIAPAEPITPFAACEGKAAEAAAVVRKWSGIGLTIGAGFKIFEMVMGAFGAMRQVKIMSGHDWTGPDSGRF